MSSLYSSNHFTFLVGYPLGFQHEYTLGLGHQKSISFEIYFDFLVRSYTVLVGSNVSAVEATKVHHERAVSRDPHDTMDLRYGRIINGNDVLVWISAYGVAALEKGEILSPVASLDGDSPDTVTRSSIVAMRSHSNSIYVLGEVSILLNKNIRKICSTKEIQNHRHPSVV